MSLRARKPLIFFFILGASALGAAMVFFFGGRDKISQHQSFLVYFSDNINGLVSGSQVKFKGVPIGYVDSIRFDYRPPGDSRLPVIIQLNVDRLKSQLGVIEDLYDPAVLAAQVRRGLRAELDNESYVTGQMFVELDFHAPAPPITPTVIPAGRPDLPIIPTAASGAVRDIQKIQDIIAWLPTFDFRTEIEKSGSEIDHLTTMVAVIPYAEYSQNVQRTLGPLDRFNFNSWQRNFDNYFNRFTRYQSAINTANTNFYAQSQDFVAMSKQARGQLEQINAQLASFRDALQPDNPTLAHLTHNLEQLSKDMQNLTGKLNAVEQQPRILDKVGR